MQIVSSDTSKSVIAALLHDGESPVIVDYKEWCEVWSQDRFEIDDLREIFGIEPMYDAELRGAPPAEPL